MGDFLLPVSTLPYDGKCEVKIIVNIHGTEKEVGVLVDTGFVTGTGFGLKLPAEFARYANYTGTGHIRVADGREVAADSIPDAKIIQIEEHRLREEVTIPTIFMSGPRACIGVLYLQRCILRLDGPSRIATIEF